MDPLPFIMLVVGSHTFYSVLCTASAIGSYRRPEYIMPTTKYEPRTFRLSTAMHSAWVIAITAFALSTITQAGNYTTVTVGKNGRFGFEPPFLSGFVGFTFDPLTKVSSGSIVFQVYDSEADPPYNISESTFEQPCVHKPGGLWLWDVPTGRNFSEFSLATDNETRWFHDSTASRCAAGMVFAINPTLAQTYEAFRATAMGKNASAINEPSPSPSPSPNSSMKPTSATSFVALAGVILLIQLSL